MRLLLHAVFLKMKKLLQSFKYPLLFYFELDLNMCSKKIFYHVSQNACQKNALMTTKVSCCFALDKANGLEKVSNMPKRCNCSFA